MNFIAPETNTQLLIRCSNSMVNHVLKQPTFGHKTIQDVSNISREKRLNIFKSICDELTESQSRSILHKLPCKFLRLIIKFLALDDFLNLQTTCRLFRFLLKYPISPLYKWCRRYLFIKVFTRSIKKEQIRQEGLKFNNRWRDTVGFRLERLNIISHEDGNVEIYINIINEQFDKRHLIENKITLGYLFFTLIIKLGFRSIRLFFSGPNTKTLRISFLSEKIPRNDIEIRMTISQKIQNL
jgi:hypothetical protein